MVKLSTIVILVGVVSLVVPIPPIASAAVGILVILAGVLLRVLFDV